MIFYIGSIIIFKLMISNLFKKKQDLHSLFRSFFCFFISMMSLFFSINNWNILIQNPLQTTQLSLIINKLMFSYMLFDTIYFIQSNTIRIELIFHHIICLLLYGLCYDKSILSFCALGEILSAFNWIGILYPKYEWTVKLFRLYSILFIRFYVWFFTLFFLSNYKFLYWFALVMVIIFICLDCYWSWIIITNLLKYKKFIEKKILTHHL